MPRTPTTSAVAALLGAVLLAGCGAPDPGPARADQPLSTATEEEPATPSASTPTSGSVDDDAGGTGQEATPFVPLDRAGEAPGSGSASIVGVRTGEHEGYERVVLDLAGEPEQVAGWFVGAVPQPLQDASGELLDVEGDRFLDLAVTGIANGGDGQVDSAGRRAFVGAVGGTGGLVEQVWVGGAWEGQAQVLLGLDEAVSEYRVVALSDPQRIVVDVR
ncbi:AMIN-like domain-containing (lipo)protein [Quadrisphaera setariae]|uniref:AMIN-like domain-containing (lipo)protein n=1 Tax=Quadrisphaera setariae TaxID=2593304 RepID=UPI001C9CF047|nr:hypothetical protein [Quadrisphaera setariae]